MIVYADILFAVNFSMDFISLFITSLVMHKKINKTKILISASIGGLYGVFNVLCSVHILVGVLLNIFVSFLMCFILFYEKSIRRFVAMYIIFWGVSATLAGFMSVLYSFMNKVLSEYILKYSYSKVYNGARFFLITSMSMLVVIIFSRIFSKEKSIKSITAIVKYHMKDYKITALCDSGNLLTDPFSGKNVILVSNGSELGRCIESTPDIYKRYIPYNSADSNGVLKGISPDCITISGRNVDAIVAPINKKNFAGFDACVPNSLI